MGPERSTRALGGFTLLEMIVALAVGAAVVLGVHAAVTVTTEVAERGRDRADTTLRAEGAQSVIRRWLRAAHVTDAPTGPGFEGRDRESLGRSLDDLEFLTLDPVLMDVPPGTPMIVRLRVSQADGLVAEYRPYGSGSPAGRLQLAAEVSGMRLRYLVDIGDETRWFDGWSSRVRLPRAVEVRLDAAPGQELPDLFRVPLLIALPRQG